MVEDSKNNSTPKRFIDRKDRNEIISTSKGFSYRTHNTIPNWLFFLFALLLLTFVVILFHMSNAILEARGQQSSPLYLIQYLILSFSVLAGYSIYLIRRLKDSLNSAEFVALSVTKTLENHSSSFCILSKNGKIYYYNSEFSQNYMISNEVEKKDYSQIMDRSTFSADDLEKIKDCINNNKESILGNSVKFRIYPLTRPEGTFAITLVK